MNTIIAKNLKKLRATAKYSQEEVAQALGINRSTYSNYESGQREMPYDLLEASSILYGIDMMLLFEDSDEVTHQLMATAFRLNGLSETDMSEILYFKDIVKSYLKMSAIETR